jgi:hypothetical protein
VVPSSDNKVVFQLKQLPLDEWPEILNDEVIMISLEPTDINRRCGIVFDISVDSLDQFEGAVAFVDGRIFALLRYRGNPTPGTGIVVEEGTFKIDLGVDQMKPILDALGASPNDVIWVRQVPMPRYFT